LFLRRDPLPDRVVSAAALQLQLHGLPDRYFVDDGVYGIADQHAAAVDRSGRSRSRRLPQRGAIDMAKDIDIGARENRPKRWRAIWSAGHSTSGVEEVLSVDEMIARTIAEYRAASRDIVLA